MVSIFHQRIGMSSKYVYLSTERVTSFEKVHNENLDQKSARQIKGRMIMRLT